MYHTEIFIFSTGTSCFAHFFVVSSLSIVVRLSRLVFTFPRLIPCPVASAAEVAPTSTLPFSCPCPTTATPSSSSATTATATLAASATSYRLRVRRSTSAAGARRYGPRERLVARELVLQQYLILHLWLGKNSMRTCVMDGTQDGDDENVHFGRA